MRESLAYLTLVSHYTLACSNPVPPTAQGRASAGRVGGRDVPVRIYCPSTSAWTRRERGPAICGTYLCPDAVHIAHRIYDDHSFQLWFLDIRLLKASETSRWACDGHFDVCSMTFPEDLSQAKMSGDPTCGGAQVTEPQSPPAGVRHVFARHPRQILQAAHDTMMAYVHNTP